ncbi:serine/threonine-protein kinase [Oikeobacillus pervagus]|uniref:Serine/threonine-protein kinase n=1 Tax=Oikeobacillus pervagus TaxID=1325931 RepID=A0AAJ1WHG8_9BACI|nr:protein kinase family protein [Oikeobacillus pervagus]MDQ0216182.1 serine/threonine-protein kinase [Oikeobacillus pervagus]
MMMNSLKNQYKLPIGTVLRGKWHQHQYKIIKELGFGANGIVYLVQSSNGYAALKMSPNSLSIITEVNVLKAFSKVQGSALGPSLLDVDDWQWKGELVPFYVMEYIHGRDLLSFVRVKGCSWIGVLLSQLLSDLQSLHEEGWVFGDLKPENLIVTENPNRIRCIDVGGTTIKGRAIKEFTEFFDRGYWGLGSRKAEPTYDLFAVSMIAINLAYPKRFDKHHQGDSLSQLVQSIRQKQELTKIEPVLIKALQGQYKSASEMRRELLHCLSYSRISKRKKEKQKKQPMNQKINKNNTTSKQLRKRKKKGKKLETLIIILTVALLYTLYILGQLI